MMKSLGHTVILYGSEENEAPCDELVTVVTKREQKKLLKGSQYQYAGFDNRYELWALANGNTIRELGKRKQPGDFLCLIGGTSQQEIASAHPDILCVEYSIGYVGSFAPYRVYESTSWQHYSHGAQNLPDGRFFDTVIPYFFDPSEFEFRLAKEPFALYVGRLTPRKGIAIACEAAAAAGVPLKVIGHGDTKLVTHGAEYLGVLSEGERNDWMSRASCLMAPTQYIEPFGSTAVEAQMCGTPAITTDFGGFTETVEHGKTGFRCSYLGEFVDALKSVAKLDNAYIRNRAIRLYSMDSVKDQYQAFFERLSLLRGRGWYSLKGAA